MIIVNPPPPHNRCRFNQYSSRLMISGATHQTTPEPCSAGEALWLSMWGWPRRGKISACKRPRRLRVLVVLTDLWWSWGAGDRSSASPTVIRTISLTGITHTNTEFDTWDYLNQLPLTYFLFNINILSSILLIVKLHSQLNFSWSKFELTLFFSVTRKRKKKKKEPTHSFYQREWFYMLEN